MPEDVSPDRSYTSPPPGDPPASVDHTDPEEQSYPLEEAMKAQAALRSAARLSPERFPLSQIIGMFSAEIEKLRAMGRPDSEIAALITGNSIISVTADEIARFYASQEERQKTPGAAEGRR